MGEPNSNSSEDKSSEETPAADEPTIRLDHFLQACGVDTGGQAKQLIQNGNVLLNGIVETRRRKKLRAGDEVEFSDEVFVVTATG